MNSPRISWVLQNQTMLPVPLWFVVFCIVNNILLEISGFFLNNRLLTKQTFQCPYLPVNRLLLPSRRFRKPPASHRNTLPGKRATTRKIHTIHQFFIVPIRLKILVQRTDAPTVLIVIVVEKAIAVLADRLIPRNFFVRVFWTCVHIDSLRVAVPVCSIEI